MFSLLAIAAFFLGLVAMPAMPVLGFLMASGGVASAFKAMKRPDDLPFALGVMIAVAGAYAVWTWALFMVRALE